MTADPRRFTRSNPCPVCGGHDGLGRGQGVRCFGYLDDSGTYARCTREEYAGNLLQNRDGTYSHRLNGPCRCGQVHGDGYAPTGEARPAATPDGSLSRAPQRFRSYFTLSAFLRKRYGEGTAITPWIYNDADGREIFRVLRIDYQAPSGEWAKSYRPCHQGVDGRWQLSRPDGPLPLYNLPALITAPPETVVTVLEGEKCADIAAGLGLSPVTTSAHGAVAPQLTDWSSLAGRRIAILRDEGERGGEYAARIAAILASLVPPAEVRIVRLDGLSDGEDIEQWIEHRRSEGRPASEILSELAGLLEASRPPAEIA